MLCVFREATALVVAILLGGAHVYNVGAKKKGAYNSYCDDKHNDIYTYIYLL